MLVRRNIIFMLMSVEIMLNAAGLAFVVAGARWGQATGKSCSFRPRARGGRGVGRPGAGVAVLSSIRSRLTRRGLQNVRMK